MLQEISLDRDVQDLIMKKLGIAPKNMSTTWREHDPIDVCLNIFVLTWIITYIEKRFSPAVINDFRPPTPIIPQQLH